MLLRRGDVGKERHHDKECLYSRCIRQTLYKLSKEGKWRQRYNISIGTREEEPGGYTDLLSSRCVFCLC